MEKEKAKQLNGLRKNRFWIIAILILIMGTGYWLVNDLKQSDKDMAIETVLPEENDEINTDSAAPKPSITNIIFGAQPVLSYQINPYLETLVNRFVGKPQAKGSDIKILTKSFIKADIGNVELKWMNPDEENLILELFDNTGVKLLRIETRDTKIKPSQINQAALYYWKLFDRNVKLIFCGKISLNAKKQ